MYLFCTLSLSLPSPLSLSLPPSLPPPLSLSLPPSLPPPLSLSFPPSLPPSLSLRLSCNTSKNRYKDVVCYDSTRVVLSTIDGVEVLLSN